MQCCESGFHPLRTSTCRSLIPLIHSLTDSSLHTSRTARERVFPYASPAASTSLSLRFRSRMVAITGNETQKRRTSARTHQCWWLLRHGSTLFSFFVSNTNKKYKDGLSLVRSNNPSKAGSYGGQIDGVLVASVVGAPSDFKLKCTAWSWSAVCTSSSHETCEFFVPSFHFQTRSFLSSGSQEPLPALLGVKAVRDLWFGNVCEAQPCFILLQHCSSRCSMMFYGPAVSWTKKTPVWHQINDETNHRITLEWQPFDRQPLGNFFRPPKFCARDFFLFVKMKWKTSMFFQQPLTPTVLRTAHNFK